MAKSSRCPISPDGKHYAYKPMMGESIHCRYCGWKPKQ